MKLQDLVYIHLIQQPQQLENMFFLLHMERFCQQVLNETLRTAKLTPIAARLQDVEGKVDQHLIPKEVSDSWTIALTGACYPGSSVFNSYPLLY